MTESHAISKDILQYKNGSFQFENIIVEGRLNSVFRIYLTSKNLRNTLSTSQDYFIFNTINETYSITI
jgi:hypothetical protein